MGTLLARLERVHASYGSRRVLNGLSIEINHGEQLALLGPSGAGKSTVLNLLTHHLRPDSGLVAYERDGLRTGIASQEPLLFDWLTVAENVRLGHGFGANHAADRGEADELIALLGLAEHAHSYPEQLSGGLAQRVSLARAFAIAPDLLLLDEPLSALDPRTRSELQVWLRRTLVDRGLSSVVVTHDIDEALVLADRIVLLSSEGQIKNTWLNPHPAADQAAALLHPLRPQIRRGYDPGAETDDAEFSGFGPLHG